MNLHNILMQYEAVSFNNIIYLYQLKFYESPFFLISYITTMEYTLTQVIQFSRDCSGSHFIHEHM